MIQHYQKAQFLLSVAEAYQLPKDEGYEVAFVGCSNAGKSSVLNRVTQQKNLARTSNTPGRTQLINFFGIDEKRRLVDLPGYGYAKAPLAVKERWQKNVNAYFQQRTSLKGVILIMDIRHPLRPLDKDLLQYCHHFSIPVHLLLNKSDKLSKEKVMYIEKNIMNILKMEYPEVTCQSFSALRGHGIDQLRLVLSRWFEY